MSKNKSVTKGTKGTKGTNRTNGTNDTALQLDPGELTVAQNTGVLLDIHDKSYQQVQPKAKAASVPPIPESEIILPKPERVNLRSYQQAIFDDRETGVLVLHWSRQIGKSYTLAAWAVDRLVNRPGRLVTVLSNSRENGAEFILKVTELCRLFGRVCDLHDDSPDLKFENMRLEVRIMVKGQMGRIKVLAANPRTARGFSGDLILDEFAFHENSKAIWEAAEPILSSNPDFLCRIASTGNGKHNMFYRIGNGAGPGDGTPFISTSGFKVSRVTRTAANAMGVAIYDPNTRQPTTPEAARRKALDKRAYDQNYECAFADENMVLLTHELIQQAERGGGRIDEQDWSESTLERFAQAEGELFVGGDIGRHRDISVFAVLEKIGATRRVVGLLRLAGMRLPAQQERLDVLCAFPQFQRAAFDLTGIGLGLVEYAQEKWGSQRVIGINFSSTEPLNEHLRAEGRKGETVRVTEAMATDLLACLEERSLELHVELDSEARDDLRKPEKITSPGGRVSIAAVRNEAGHADHFWALALAVRASMQNVSPGRIEVFPNTAMSRAVMARRERWVVG